MAWSPTPRSLLALGLLVVLLPVAAATGAPGTPDPAAAADGSSPLPDSSAAPEAEPLSPAEAYLRGEAPEGAPPPVQVAAAIGADDGARDDRRAPLPPEPAGAEDEAGGPAPAAGEAADPGCGDRDRHPPIRIQGDEGLLGPKLADHPLTGEPVHRPGSGVVAGNGTAGNPYVIAGWCIEASDPFPAGIHIRETDAHFRIQDVVLEGASFDSEGILLEAAGNVAVRETLVHGTDGVVLDEGTHATLVNVTVTGTDWYHAGVSVEVGSTLELRESRITGAGTGVDIFLGGDGHRIVDNNISSNFDEPVEAFVARNLTIAGNSLEGDDGYGGAPRLDLDHVQGAVLANNTVSDGARYGMLVDDSTDVRIENNTVTGHSWASLILGDTRDAAFHGNTFGRGIYIFGDGAEHYTHRVGPTNTVQGEPLRYVSEADGVAVPAPAGQVVVANASDVLVEDLTLANATNGILAGFSTNLTVRGNNLSASDHGLHVQGGNGTVVEDNRMAGTTYDGAFLYRSGDVEVRGNAFNRSGGEGLSLWEASRVNVTGNLFIDNDYEAVEAGHSSEIHLDGNTIVAHDDSGLETWEAANVTVRNNTFNGNEDSAVENFEGPTVDARFNWWGCPDGPEAAACDDAEGKVLFDPWLESPNGTAGPDANLSAPENLTGEGEPGRVHLEWDPPSQGVAVSYVVYRGPDDCGSQMTAVVEVPADETAYVDRDLDPGGEYCYAVAAEDLEGDTNRTDGILAQADPVPDPAVDELQVEKTKLRTEYTPPVVNPVAAYEIAVEVENGGDHASEADGHRSAASRPGAASVGITVLACPQGTANHEAGTAKDAAFLERCERVRHADLDPLEAGAARTVEARWDPAGHAGDYEFLVLLDYHRPEEAEANNQARTETFVVAGGTGAGGAQVGPPEDASDEEAWIQPGDLVDGICTLNFVYDSQDSQEVYIGTAGHCVGVGRTVDTPGHPDFGTVVYDSYPSYPDFALIRVHPDEREAVRPNPKGHPGLPTGSTDDQETRVGDPLRMSGYGIPYGQEKPTRENRLAFLSGDTARLYRAEAMVSFGDSGGPIVHAGTGKALGVVSRLPLEPGVPSTLTGPTVQGILDALDDGGYDLEVRTALG